MKKLMLVVVAFMLFGFITKAQPSTVEKPISWWPNTTILVSPNQEYRLVYQNDGNLVIYDKSDKALWHTNTIGRKPFMLKFTGSLMMWGLNDRLYWASRFKERGGTTLRLDDNGSLSIWNAEKAIWKSEDQKARVSPEEAMKNMPTVYKVGDRGPRGGYIFYAKEWYSDGWKYLEAAPEDLGEYKWGWYNPLPENVTRANKTELGTGNENTVEICKAFLPMCGQYYTVAAVECDRFNLGSSDWYLPTIDELKLMYENLAKNNIGNFNKKETYWSSTITSKRTCAYYIHFKSGIRMNTGIEGSCRVRPIHRF